MGGRGNCLSALERTFVGLVIFFQPGRGGRCTTFKLRALLAVILLLPLEPLVIRGGVKVNLTAGRVPVNDFIEYRLVDLDGVCQALK